MTSPYLTAKEAAEYVKAPSVKAFNDWVTNRGVSCAGRRGRIRLFTKDTLDRVLRHDALRSVQQRERRSAR